MRMAQFAVARAGAPTTSEFFLDKGAHICYGSPSATGSAVFISRTGSAVPMSVDRHIRRPGKWDGPGTTNKKIAGK
jgi:hypothetical protein